MRELLWWLEDKVPLILFVLSLLLSCVLIVNVARDIDNALALSRHERHTAEACFSAGWGDYRITRADEPRGYCVRWENGTEIIAPVEDVTDAN